MDIYRLIFAHSKPIGFNQLFYCLMTEEANIKPMSTLVETFCGCDIFVNLLKPFMCYTQSIHHYVIIRLRLQIYEVFLKNPIFFC